MLEFEKLQREKINVFQRRLQFASERCRLLDVYNQKIQADLAVAIKKCVQLNSEVILKMKQFYFPFQSHRTHGNANH